MSTLTELAEKLKTEGERLTTFFSGLTDDQWQAEVYTDETVWTIRNVLAHFVTTERAFITWLFPKVRSGEGGVSEDFSIDRYNARQQEKVKDLKPGELLELYKSVRSEIINWVLALDESDLEKTGRHPFLGLATLDEMIKTVYRHNQIHYHDMRKALSKDKPRIISDQY
jgi:uncharacterized damage-inducible protein DinB